MSTAATISDFTGPCQRIAGGPPPPQLRMTRTTLPVESTTTTGSWRTLSA